MFMNKFWPAIYSFKIGCLFLKLRPLYPILIFKNIVDKIDGQQQKDLTKLLKDYFCFRGPTKIFLRK